MCGKKRERGIIIYRGVLFLGKSYKSYKWRDINGERGGEEGIENQNLQSFHLALILLSSCSFQGIEAQFGIETLGIGIGEIYFITEKGSGRQKQWNQYQGEGYFSYNETRR